MKGTIFKKTRPGSAGDKRKEAFWCADIDLPRGSSGKRRRRRLTGFRTRKEAQIEVARTITELQTGIDVAPQNWTVRDLLERYIANRQLECGAKTVERYREIADLCINPMLGDVSIRKLSALSIQEHYLSLAKRLAPRTVHHVHTLLKAAFKWADRKKLTHTPFSAVDAPRVRQKEVQHLSPEQADALIRAAEGSLWHSPLILALATGARRGEICALKWSDIDFENRTLTIRASLSDADGKLQLKGTKTDNVRNVPLSSMATAVLRARRVEVAQAKLLAGASYRDEGYVFAGPFGQPMVPDCFTAAFRRYAKKASIKEVTLHSLRHTAATWMLSAGTDVRNVQAILGHSVASTTLNVYAHAVRRIQNEAVNVIDANLAGASRSTEITTA